MSVWQYGSSDRRVESDIVAYFKSLFDMESTTDRGYILDAECVSMMHAMSYSCDYCQCTMSVWCDRDEVHEIGVHEMEELAPTEAVLVCDSCGWWVDLRIGGKFVTVAIPSDIDERNSPMGVLVPNSLEVSSSTLKDLDLSDLSAPIEEVKAYIRARYEDRFDVHPRMYEALVSSVFQDVGYETELTKYSADGGIDVILRRGENEEIGVQVKRYRNRIQVNQIRELIGALVVNGYTKGVFVTTSDFTRGARLTVEQARSRGLYIDLIGDNSFLPMLNVSQVESYRDYGGWDACHRGRSFVSVGHVLSALLGA